MHSDKLRLDRLTIISICGLKQFRVSVYAKVKWIFMMSDLSILKNCYLLLEALGAKNHCSSKSQKIMLCFFKS